MMDKYDHIAEILEELTYEVGRVAKAITPVAAAGTDEAGGRVESLTEAVMGVTKGLCLIASAINGLADAVSEGR